jgi:hypothetical protein
MPTRPYVMKCTMYDQFMVIVIHRIIGAIFENGIEIAYNVAYHCRL